MGTIKFDDETDPLGIMGPTTTQQDVTDALTPLGDPNTLPANPIGQLSPLAQAVRIPIDTEGINALQKAYDTPYTEDLTGRPKPMGLGSALKYTLLGKVPIIGSALVEPAIAKRQQAIANWQLKQQEAHEHWKYQQAMIGEMLKDQYKQAFRVQNINRYASFLMSAPGSSLPPLDAMRWAEAIESGKELPKLDGLEPVNLILKGEEDAPIVALKDSWGHFVRGTPMGIRPVNIGDILHIEKIGTASTAPTHMEAKKGKLDGKEAWANYDNTTGKWSDSMGNDVSGKFVPDEPGGNGLQMQLRDMLQQQRSLPMLSTQYKELSGRIADTKAALMAVPTGSFNLAEPGREKDRVTKSYEYHTNQLEKVRKPLEDALDRFSRLEETVAQNTPQADALVGPELLTVMAGGQGSGLRMNEAEIARIIGGRSKWETLKAKVASWSRDPKAAQSITPEQRSQIRMLMSAVRKKSDYKQAVLSMAQDALMKSENTDEHRKIYSQAKDDLFAIGQGNLRVVNGEIYDRQKDGTWLPRQAKP